MSERNQINVNIGEIKISHGDDILKATLGSCVGIAFLWKKKGVYGMAHCLLSEDINNKSPAFGGKFVTNAIPSLLYMMKIKQEDYDDIEVYIAGGGNMMEQLSRRNPQHIGKLNVDMAKKVLKETGLKITGSLVGGDQAHRIEIDCLNGTVEMTKLDKLTSKTEGKHE